MTNRPDLDQWNVIVETAGPGAEVVLFARPRGEGDIVARVPLAKHFDFGAANVEAGSIGIVDADENVVFWQNFAVVIDGETTFSGDFDLNSAD